MCSSTVTVIVATVPASALATSEPSRASGASSVGDACVLARNLVAADAGTHFISVAHQGWDLHSKIYDKTQKVNHYTLCRELDDCYASLLDDLAAMTPWRSLTLTPAQWVSRPCCSCCGAAWSGGVPPPTRLQLSPELQRRKTIDLLVQWTLSFSAAQPLIVFVEDLHWCDVSTLELLGHLIAQSPTARVLLLATARPEFTPPWPARSNLTTVQLARPAVVARVGSAEALG
jgi:hypothetical protein